MLNLLPIFVNLSAPEVIQNIGHWCLDQEVRHETKAKAEGEVSCEE